MAMTEQEEFNGYLKRVVEDIEGHIEQDEKDHEHLRASIKDLQTRQNKRDLIIVAILGLVFGSKHAPLLLKFLSAFL
jgi:hypothetical protein